MMAEDYAVMIFTVLFGLVLSIAITPQTFLWTFIVTIGVLLTIYVLFIISIVLGEKLEQVIQND